ncbi:tumor necrosis factor ligand superfamily member 12 isoform X1 [Myxocyprinus asiaticus]|uniref:tumor necrosis factor ligand superfamily member 12 isoform X1 n=1 Tax=Myxocyprinus asiaticus TaxID=70543 RepID=UPI002222220B|nr:tumor necrosis factor ligand superfamily member 12 isoform X1 [Myxocyprinus asiaticus]
MDFTLRAATLEDCKDISRMILELAEHEKVSDQIKITQRGHTKIGYSLYFYTYSSWKGRAVYMEDLYVMQEFRGKGIGKALMAKVAQVNMQRKAIFQLILEKRELLESHRFRRDVGGKKGNGRKVASHFEITKDSAQNVGNEGVIKGWTEEHLNMSRAVHYNPDTGTFKVERNGVYFLYCQVHFNENQSQYVKLEVSVSNGPLLQCMEGYGTTPASGSHKFHFLKPCQVSGLLRLNKGAELKAVTGGSFSLQVSGKHYFGLFKVN